MKKPVLVHQYSTVATEMCERVLVTLLRHLGPWRDSIFLVGGLVPRYLIKERPPTVPAHAGTGDVDVMVDMMFLADIEAYRTLEENIRAIGFNRSENDKGQKLSWRWQREFPGGMILLLEFLTDSGDAQGGVLQELPSDGDISAIHIPHSGMVFDHHETVEVTAELLDGGGVTTETIRYADIVSFTCLKALAFDHRFEPKDAHDLCYCLEHFEGGTEVLRDAFTQALKGAHAGVVRDAICILAARFCDDEHGDGYRKDGPVAAARFEGAESWDDEGRTMRQHELSSVVQNVLEPFL